MRRPGVLITGASGEIGHGLITRLAAEGATTIVTLDVRALDPTGQPVRTVAAADPVDPELRPYSVTAIPGIDRAVSTTSDMEAVAQGSSFQLWRLSDLKLLATVPLPRGPLGYEHKDPAEVRLLPDGTAILTTFSCAMYRLHDLATGHPQAELINVLPWATYDTDDCAIPVTRGRFWVQTFANAKGSALISFDLSDPSHPVEVDRLRPQALDERVELGGGPARHHAFYRAACGLPLKTYGMAPATWYQPRCGSRNFPVRPRSACHLASAPHLYQVWSRMISHFG